MKRRLELAGMDASATSDALSQFKAASALFINGHGPQAATEYLEAFLGLFGSEGLLLFAFKLQC